MMRITVEGLLEPFSFSQFREAYYEKQPLLISRRVPSYYDGLLTLDALDAHLGALAQESFAAEEKSLLARFYEGDTIAVPSYERHHAALLHLLHDMERVFHSPVTTCVYLTPRSAQGSSERQEDDTFILPFAGTRDWTIHDGSGTPVIATALGPGDLLYVPGGLVHEARSADAVAGHMTFVLQKFTYADLLRQIADNADASPWLRRSLPVDFRRGALQREFLRQVHQFFDDADLPAYLERMHGDFAEERLPDATNRLADYVRLPSIGAASRFRRRSGVWPELTNGGGQVVLTLHGKSLEFPAPAGESIRFMIEAQEFAASALPGDGDENLALCGTLVREGFLTIVS